MELEFTDRYQALGIPYPNPKTMCKGDCEGTGWVPIFENDDNPVYKRLWKEAEAQKPTDDGSHFVVCPRCRGSRLEPPTEARDE
jgi:hypothetical protein